MTQEEMEQKRLEQIKLEKVLFQGTKCKKCNNIFVHEKMWCVPRWGHDRARERWYYCQHCLSTPKDVLNEIDSDDNQFGIFSVDSYPNHPFKKKKIKYTSFMGADGRPVRVPDTDD